MGDDMKKGIRVDGVNYSCIKCRREYNINDVVEKAKAIRARIISCPYCGSKLGTIN